MGRKTILGSLTLMAISSCGSPPPAPTPLVQVPVAQQSAMPAPSPSSQMTAQTIPIDTLVKGNDSDLHQPGYQIIRSAGELDSLVQQAGLQAIDTDVDWKNQMVIAAFAGDRPGTLEITSLQAKADQLIAKVNFQPGTAATASGVGTRAYHLIVVPKSSLELDVRGLPDPVAAVPAPAASAAASATPPAPVPSAQSDNVAQLIAQGPHSGVKQPVNVIIQTNEEWQAVWGTHSQGSQQAQAQPTIDLTRQTVIGIFLGTMSQGAGGIAIDSMAPVNGKLVVQAHVVGGGQGSTEPFVLVAIPKIAAEVDIQVQGGPQAQTLGNPSSATQAAQPAQPAALAAQPGFGQPVPSGARPGFGQPVAAGPQPGFGQPVGGSSLGGMQGVTLGGAQAAPALPARASILGGGTGGLLGPGGYTPPR